MQVLLLFLSTSLIVGNALCLGGSGILGSECQHDQGDQEGQDTEQASGINTGSFQLVAQILQGIDLVPIDIYGGVTCGDTLAKAKEEGRTGSAQGLPVAEDHNGQCQEAKACHITGGCTVGSGQGIHKAADTGQRTGNDHARIPHLVNIDAQRGGSLGVFAAGTKPQTKLGLIKDHRQNDKQNPQNIVFVFSAKIYM